MIDQSVERFLMHTGVKGMRWGIRKGDITPTDTTFGLRTHSELVLTQKLKNGGELNVVEKGFEDKGRATQWLIAHNKTFRNNRNKIHEFTLKDKTGANVGQATFFDQPKQKSMYMADLKIYPDHRRQGYAKATLQAGIAYAQEKNYKTITMISSPMGAPLYTSLGFKSLDGPSADVNKEVKSNKEEGWAEYSMDISNHSVTHVDIDTDINRLAELIVQYVDLAEGIQMSNNTEINDFLAHFGKKGMHWGVRNDAGHEGEQAKTKTIAKLDKKFESQFNGTSGYFKLHNEFAGEMNKRLGKFNDDFDRAHPTSSKIKDINKPDPVYLKAYEKVVEESCLAAAKNFGSNASGTLRVNMVRSGEGVDATWSASFEETKVKHADVSGPHFKITPKFNSVGRIISQKIEVVAGDELQQIDDLGDFLEHYGVKGMHWGARGRVIETARANAPGLKRDTAKAEKAYLSQTTAQGKKAALKLLQSKEKVEWENARTARSMKRGEQLALGLATVAVANIASPVVLTAAIAGVGVGKYLNRDSKQFKSQYPEVLKGQKHS